MHLSVSLLGLVALPSVLAQATFQRSSKRGLIFINNTKYAQDDHIWTEPGSDLTWYYNYADTPSAAYSSLSQSQFEYVPMLFGSTVTNFRQTVQGLISSGTNISHVMTFNEPDGTSDTGGSQVDPNVAASMWQSEIAPLRKQGIKAGAPAVTGSQGGFTWLANFFSACQSLGQNCTVDFIPIHWYGNFEGLASHIGQVVATYPNISIWVTEYALPNDNLANTQSFFNSSAEYFDRISYIERYSYFGSFRSSVSNVGPYAAMLDENGNLTDIGSWYLGGAATGIIPSGSDTASGSGNKNGAGRIQGNHVWALLVAVLFYAL
ncbi:glycosyl hydrolase catalytic core-domain-containing protein [Xylogone sp. PMI_703]|nr:glycosyl hydrolase catalytic core-domain-containing protein [Xylogone sp. PMI_703]